MSGDYELRSGRGFHRTDADIISELNELKSNFQLQDSIGTRYLKKISGDLSLILK